MFSKPCKYGIRATLLLGRESSDDAKMGVQQIADQLDLPKHYLAKILQQLSKHGIISSVKGPNGGFYLSKSNLEKPLIDIIKCIDGPESLSACILGLPTCSDVNPCPLHNQILFWRQNILTTLGTKSVEKAVHDVSINNYII